MQWKAIQHYSIPAFQRLVGVKPSTFEAMVQEVKKVLNKKRVKKKKGKKGGRKPRLSVEDQILMSLSYWREYRTLFHTGASYGLSESAASRTINAIENILSKGKKFALPGKKKLSKTKMQYEVILVDATESPIERPKKNSIGIIPERKSNTH